MPWIGSTSMLGMLRAALAKPALSSAPSMISALVRPRPEKLPTRALVLASLSCALSITTRPPSLPSRVLTFNSISRALLLGRRFRSLARDLELAGLRRFLRQRLLDRVAHPDPAALGAGNGAFDEDQAALDIGRDHAQVQRGDAVDAHVAGHL